VLFARTNGYDEPGIVLHQTRDLVGTHQLEAVWLSGSGVGGRFDDRGNSRRRRRLTHFI